MASLDSVCEGVVKEVDDALACGVVDLSSGMLMGVHHIVAYFTQTYLDAVAAAAVDMFRGKTVARVEQLLSKVRGQEVKGAFEEVFIKSTKVFHFMKVIQENNAVVVLVTKTSTNQGIGWVALRNAISDVKERLP